MGRLIIDGNRIYELDEACIQRKKNEDTEKRKRSSEYVYPDHRTKQPQSR